MNTAKTNEIARHVRSLVGKNRIDEALAALYNYFSSVQEREWLNDVTALQARYYGLTQAITRGTISEADAGIQRGQICNSILLMLDTIAPDTSPPAPSKPVKKGKMLHNIPDSMKVGEVIECRVRIATTEKQLRKNFRGADHIESIPLERMGELMEVRLVAGDSEAFIIKRQNKHAAQTIEADVHTEWVFDVIPMKPGRQKLFLKVDIILLDRGKKAHRDEVISVPVEVSTAAPTSSADWQAVADLAPRPGQENFISRIFGGFLGSSGKEGNKRALSLAIVGVACILLAQMLWPFHDDTMGNPLFSGIYKRHHVGVLVHSYSDSVAEQFTMRNRTEGWNRSFQLKWKYPGVWEGLMEVPQDTSRYDIYYRGNVAQCRWENVLLKDPTILYVPIDTSICGVYIKLDTVVYPVERWKMVWEKGAREQVTFSVIPLSNNTFFVPLGQWCNQLYDPAKKYNFYLENGSLRLYAREVSLKERPFILRFYPYNPSSERAALSSTTPISATPETYITTSVSLAFNRPISMTGMKVNGRSFTKYVPYDAADGPGKKAGASFRYERQAKSEGPESLTVEVLSDDCNCKKKTVSVKPEDTSVKVAVQCTPKPDNKAKIFLQLPPEWAGIIEELEITVGGKSFSSHLPLKDGKIPFELPVTKETRDICILVHGRQTGQAVELACYSGPVEPKMDLKVIGGKIVMK